MPDVEVGASPGFTLGLIATFLTSFLTTFLTTGATAKLGPVTPVEGATTTPGYVKEREGDVIVGTGGLPVRLSWIQPAGKKAIDARDWWRGARWADGAQLGEA